SRLWVTIGPDSSAATTSAPGIRWGERSPPGLTIQAWIARKWRSVASGSTPTGTRMQVQADEVRQRDGDAAGVVDLALEREALGQVGGGLVEVVFGHAYEREKVERLGASPPVHRLGLGEPAVEMVGGLRVARGGPGDLRGEDEPLTAQHRDAPGHPQRRADRGGGLVVPAGHAERQAQVAEHLRGVVRRPAGDPAQMVLGGAPPLHRPLRLREVQADPAELR